VLAEQVVLPASGVVPVPEHLSDAEAACLPCAGVTAWNALFGTGATRAGETVLVLGTGGVAAFAIQFAHAAGCRVIAVSRSPAKLAAARTLGAHEAISGDDWDDQVYRLTAQQGVDHVIELGGPGTLPKSIRAVRMGGRISLIGTISGIEGPIPTANLLRKGVCLQGIFVGSRAHFLAMNRAIALHGLRPHVDREFAFTAAREAYEYLATASHVGKVVVRIAE
jgi:NADPH:quinone reductase-like Zn-dependent oxidoreductase